MLTAAEGVETEAADRQGDCNFEIVPSTADSSTATSARLQHGSHSLEVPVGVLERPVSPRNAPFTVARPGRHAAWISPELRSVLRDMTIDHAVGRDLCLWGVQGGGKSTLVDVWAAELGYVVRQFSLYADMTARDLLQRRVTDAHGNTVWHDSPLVTAMQNGDLLVLDGIQRLSTGVLGTLQRLVQDRELELPDGRFFARADAVYPADVEAIHPSFRVVATGSPQAAGRRTHSGHAAAPALHPELHSMFAFHHVPEIDGAALKTIVEHGYPSLPDTLQAQVVATHSILLERAAKLRLDGDDASAAAIRPSLRHWARLLNRAQLTASSINHEHDLVAVQHELAMGLQQALMTQFATTAVRSAVTNAMSVAGLPIADDRTAASHVIVPPTAENPKLCIGDVSLDVSQSADKHLVPAPVFVDVPQYVSPTIASITL